MRSVLPVHGGHHRQQLNRLGLCPIRALVFGGGGGGRYGGGEGEVSVH